MKKLFLLLSATGVMFSAGAQQLNHGGPFITNSVSHQVIQPSKTATATATRGHHSTTSTERTTSTPGQWYDYADYMSFLAGSSNVSGSFPYMWNDTSSLDAYGAAGGGIEYDHNTMVSYATVFDPYFTGWGGTYSSAAVVPTTSGYIIDSIGVYGIYGTNPAKTSVVDTIRIGYVHGTGYHWSGGAPTSDIFSSEFDASFAPSLLTDYSVASTDTMWFADVLYDSVTNTGIGTSYAQQDILVKNASGVGTNNVMGWNDTDANGINYKAIGLTSAVHVPAGEFFAVTVSFKTGDPAYDPTALTVDTVFVTDGATYAYYKYNMLRPEIAHYGTSSAPTFWTWDPTDHNGGLFKTLPNFENGWGNLYVPNIAWTSGGGASTLQYPLMDIHIQGSSSTKTVTNTVDKVNVYPNPASDIVNVAFNLTNASDVTVSLTNVTGQVVATQNLNGVSNGKAEFNTTALPAGVYMYTLTANGERSTGRIAVAH